ncbi:MAG: RluA family pseudouridine synthase [Acidobacteria bacterium]|nr:RluA family pseudouridine synthase [Acidobacteriota bacterium]
MGLRKLSFIVAKDMANSRLDQFLATLIPSALGETLSKAKIRKLIVAGAVYLNRNRVRIASKTLIANAQVEVYIDLAKLKEADSSTKDKSFTMSAERILFEDEFLIAVNKPSGLPTQATIDEARNNLYESLKQFLAKRDKINEPYLGIHQRLDRDTSGVILFTKDPLANKGLAQAFTEHQIYKTYQAIVSRPKENLPLNNWIVKNHLGRIRANKGKQAKYTSVNQGGDFAHTEFSLLETHKNVLLIEARPKTGRTHQIRVHLSEEAMPIIGDSLYGGKTANHIPRMMLHAYKLVFFHPITKKEITLISNLPEDFKKCLT